jgi:hypothetical protein
MPQGRCLLCGKDGDLQNSHILPAFVFRWQRETSGTGFIRSSSNPNLRVQDGVKRHWLCASCEQLFGRSEKSFADYLFYPYLKTPAGKFGYAHWLMRFCVSVSWRVLQFFLIEGELHDWSKDEIAQVRKAEGAWRQYLLSQRLRPGEFAQHLIPLDGARESTNYLEPNFNRYMMRVIDMDIVRSTTSILTYAKLGRFVIIGSVRDPNAALWRGTRVDVAQGVVGPSEYHIPESLIEYMNDKAKVIRQRMTDVSPAQRKKMDEAFRANVDRFSKSDAFRALNADVEMFGPDAFERTDEDTG